MSRIEQLKKLLEADPNDAFCLYGLAQEHLKAGEPEEALRYFDRTIEADRTYTYAFYHKARALQALGRVREAQQVCTEGLAVAEGINDEKAISELRDLQQMLS
jgi:tetratricopeptide (TPR) repeat protein